MPTLNPEYIEHISQQIDPNQLADFIKFSQRPLRKSIRINTLKISIVAFKKRAQLNQWQLTPIPWCESGFWIERPENQEQACSLGNTPEHLLGLMYIQEASSMLPAEVLITIYQRHHHKNPDLVLDMASAPGSKSTQLAAITQQNSLIIANELSSSRLKTLAHNFRRSGISNYVLTHQDGCDFKSIKNQFDAILLDAPCTGEGTIRKDKKALHNWSLENIIKISQLQIQLLQSAYSALKPGGILVYSTCTLSREENEQVCQHFLQDHEHDMEPVTLSNFFPNADVAVTENQSLKIWPHFFDSEGFFVACFLKKEAIEQNPNKNNSDIVPFNYIQPSGYWSVPESHLLHDYSGFMLDYFGFEIEQLKGQYLLKTEKHAKILWLFPEQLSHPLFQSLKPNRCGIKIADVFTKGNTFKFRLSHEFCVAFGPLFTAKCIEISANELAEIYKGKDLTGPQSLSPPSLNGDAILRYQNFVVGLVRVMGLRYKNNLPRELIAN